MMEVVDLLRFADISFGSVEELDGWVFFLVGLVVGWCKKMIIVLISVDPTAYDF